MSMDIDVFAVIPVELTREVIEQIILNGAKLGLYYDNLDPITNKEKFTDKNILSLIDYLYNNSRSFNPRVYAGVSGYIPEKSGYFLGLARGGETYFPLANNEFEIRFGEGNALYKRDFLHDRFYTDFGWYTQTVLDLTKGLPIKQLHTVLR